MSEIQKAVLREAKALVKKHLGAPWRIRLGIPTGNIMNEILFGPKYAYVGISGQTDLDRKEITINEFLIEKWPSVKFWKDIILHEIAHGMAEGEKRLLNEDSHSTTWRKCAQEIGCSGIEMGMGDNNRRMIEEKGWPTTLELAKELGLKNV